MKTVAIRRAFLCLEALFSLLFFLCDLTGRTLLLSSTVWKFLVVVFALLYVAREFFCTDREDRLFCRRLFLLFAMILTLVSDLFLLALNDHYTVGVCTFVAAQLFHALTIKRSRKQAIVSLALRLTFLLLTVLILRLAGELTMLYAAVACYAPQLIGNLIEHFVGVFRNSGEEKKRSLLLAIAFSLFFACDVCVGLSNIGLSGASLFIWIFYAPSQALIAISFGRFYNENEND